MAMTETVTRAITEPYLKMVLEKKTGKYGHEIVKVSFLCPPEQFDTFRTKALEDLKDTLNVLTNMRVPEAEP